MIIGVPVVDAHEHTENLIYSLRKTVRGTFYLKIIDNASGNPHDMPLAVIKPPRSIGSSGYIVTWRLNRNRGFYWPLLALNEGLYGFSEDDNLIGLLHNDLIFYEEGWDLRVAAAFAADPKLALIGFCGSREVDENGGRGGGTMCHFRGEVGQSQAAGERITGLRPSLVLDSMAMIFRRECIPLLGIDDDITLCHFYDKIWPMRLIAQGWHVATLGVEIDHLGGITSANEYRFGADCWRWWAERGKRFADPDMEMYLEAERRFLAEFKSWMPCSIDESYTVHRHVLAR